MIAQDPEHFTTGKDLRGGLTYDPLVKISRKIENLLNLYTCFNSKTLFLWFFMVVPELLGTPH